MLFELPKNQLKSSRAKFFYVDCWYFGDGAGISREIITYLPFNTNAHLPVFSQILAGKCLCWPQISPIFNLRRNSAYPDISHIFCLAKFIFFFKFRPVGYVVYVGPIFQFRFFIKYVHDRVSFF